MQAKRPDAKLVLAAGDPERRLVLVLFANAELHVVHGEIELGEARPSLVKKRSPRVSKSSTSRSTCHGSGTMDRCKMALPVSLQ